MAAVNLGVTELVSSAIDGVEGLGGSIIYMIMLIFGYSNTEYGNVQGNRGKQREIAEL